MTVIAGLLHEKQTSGSEGRLTEPTRHARVASALIDRDQGDAAAHAALLFRRDDQHGQSESIRLAYERCHPEDSFDDLKHRARFSKEAKGLLRDWLALADRSRNSRQPLHRLEWISAASN